MNKSTKTRRRNKPRKPYPGFPLYAHATGRWAKKIRGKLHYFGPWDDFDGALQKYLHQKDDLHAGRTPRVKGDGLTVAELCNHYLSHKQRLLDNSDIRVRTFREYYEVCAKIVAAFGRNRLVDDLASDDLGALQAKFADGRGLVSLGKDVRLTRMVFKYGHDAGLIDKPVRFGPNFKAPGKRILRQERQKNGKRMFEADQLRKIIDAARQPLKNMILLAINGGLGQTDIANLPQSAVDLESGWLDYPRPKTAVERRVPLWPETATALRDAIWDRPKSKQTGDDDLCFLTKYGQRWVRVSNSEKQSWTDSIGLEFGKLLKRVGLKRKGLNFYALRHTFETIAGESRDQVAVNAIMGHVDSSMAGVYRERISDERLKAVVGTVRQWLFDDK